MFQIDPGRPPGDFIPLENQVPNQEIDGPRAMSPLVPIREQQHHDVRQHVGLGHGQHDEMELEDMLPLQEMFNLERNDDMLEDGNAQPREHLMIQNALPKSLQDVVFGAQREWFRTSRLRKGDRPS